jgi:hypothetical protein
MKTLGSKDAHPGERAPQGERVVGVSGGEWQRKEPNHPTVKCRKPAAGGLQRALCVLESGAYVRGMLAALRIAFFRRASLRRRASHGFS